MESQRWRNVGLAIVVIAAALFLFWRARTSGVADATAPDSAGRQAASSSVADEEDASADDARSPRTRTMTGARLAPTSRAPRSDLDDERAADSAPDGPGALGDGPVSIFHGSDPCEPAAPLEIPADHDSVTAGDVTVAWPLTVAIAEPTLLAHTASGLLEEAALLTDSDRRGRVTIILHPTLDDLRKVPRAPKWAAGFYNGAVHLVATPNNDFGVRIETLRHELMHAHLHVAAGCAPAWFDEGTAMLFANRPPAAEWRRMMRERSTLPISEISIPTVANSALDEKTITAAYAQSLAMALYVQDLTGLDRAVQTLRDAPRADARESAAKLWSTLNPNVSPDDVLAWLTRRIFRLDASVSTGSLFTGGVCCTGERRLTTFSCDTAPLHGDDAHWLDPHAGACSAFGL